MSHAHLTHCIDSLHVFSVVLLSMQGHCWSGEVSIGHSILLQRGTREYIICVCIDDTAKPYWYYAHAPAWDHMTQPD